MEFTLITYNVRPRRVHVVNHPNDNYEELFDAQLRPMLQNAPPQLHAVLCTRKRAATELPAAAGVEGALGRGSGKASTGGVMNITIQQVSSDVIGQPGDYFWHPSQEPTKLRAAALVERLATWDPPESSFGRENDLDTLLTIDSEHKLASPEHKFAISEALQRLVIGLQRHVLDTDGEMKKKLKHTARMLESIVAILSSDMHVQVLTLEPTSSSSWNSSTKWKPTVMSTIDKFLAILPDDVCGRGASFPVWLATSCNVNLGFFPLSPTTVFDCPASFFAGIRHFSKSTVLSRLRSSTPTSWLEGVVLPAQNGSYIPIANRASSEPLKWNAVWIINKKVLETTTKEYSGSEHDLGWLLWEQGSIHCVVSETGSARTRLTVEPAVQGGRVECILIPLGYVGDEFFAYEALRSSEGQSMSRPLREMWNIGETPNEQGEVQRCLHRLNINSSSSLDAEQNGIIKQILEAQNAVHLIKACAGAGKSRIVHEIAEHFELTWICWQQRRQVRSNVQDLLNKHVDPALIFWAARPDETATNETDGVACDEDSLETPEEAVRKARLVLEEDARGKLQELFDGIAKALKEHAVDEALKLAAQHTRMAYLELYIPANERTESISRRFKYIITTLDAANAWFSKKKHDNVRLRQTLKLRLGDHWNVPLVVIEEGQKQPNSAVAAMASHADTLLIVGDPNQEHLVRAGSGGAARDTQTKVGEWAPLPRILTAFEVIVERANVLMLRQTYRVQQRVCDMLEELLPRRLKDDTGVSIMVSAHGDRGSQDDLQFVLCENTNWWYDATTDYAATWSADMFASALAILDSKLKKHPTESVLVLFHLNAAKNNFEITLKEVFDKDTCNKIRVRSVDSAYGTESDHVLAIYHRRGSNKINLDGIQGDELRFYETTTRARNSVTVLIDREALNASKAEYWKTLKGMLESGKYSVTIENTYAGSNTSVQQWHQRCVEVAKTWPKCVNIKQQRLPLQIVIAGPILLQT